MATTPGGFGLGALFSPPDSRDFLVAGPAHLAAVQQTNNLTQLAMPVRNQQTTNSCTGFGFAAVRAALAAKFHFDAGEDVLDLGDTISAAYIYYHTRKFEDASFPQDAGASMRGAAKAVFDYGAAPERFMPFAPARLNDAPSKAAQAAATEYSVAAFVRLGGTGPQLLTSMLQSLADGYPFALAMYVYPSMEQQVNPTNGLIPVHGRSERTRGGHCVACFGSDADLSVAGGGSVLCQNSWGEEYGMRGWFRIPWAEVLNGTVVEAWSFR